MCFTPEAGQAIRIEREEYWEDFERDVAIQRGVTRAIDFAHATKTKWSQNVVAADSSSNQRHVPIVLHLPHDERVRRDVPRRRGKKTSSLIIGGNQAFDVAAQRLVSTARLFQKRLAFTRRPLQRRVVDLLDSPPSLGRRPSGAFS